MTDPELNALVAECLVPCRRCGGAGRVPAAELFGRPYLDIEQVMCPAGCYHGRVLPAPVAEIVAELRRMRAAEQSAKETSAAWQAALGPATTVANIARCSPVYRKDQQESDHADL